MTRQFQLGFVGAGKVGHTLARLWYMRGFRVSAIYSPTHAHAQNLAERVDAVAVESPTAVLQASDLTLLTVPDDAILSVAEEMAKGGFRASQQDVKGVIHVSGAQEVELLSPLSAIGIMTGGMHPVFPFADVETAIEQLPGATFGIEVNAGVLESWLITLVEALNGRVLRIPPGQRAIYHSAMVFASNYTVTLYAIAERLLTNLGAEQEVADMALNALLGGVVENLRRKGIPDALTGPLVRGDLGTVHRHVMALSAIDAELGTLYKQLGRLSLPMLTARDIDTSLMQDILKQG